jgi:hypothetical protein
MPTKFASNSNEISWNYSIKLPAIKDSLSAKFLGPSLNPYGKVLPGYPLKESLGKAQITS